MLFSHVDNSPVCCTLLESKLNSSNKQTNGQQNTPHQKPSNFLGSVMQCSDSREAICHCHEGELRSLAKSVITAFPSLAAPEPQSHEPAASGRHLPRRRASCRLLPHLPPQRLLLASLVCRLHYGHVKLDRIQVSLIRTAFVVLQQKYGADQSCTYRTL